MGGGCRGDETGRAATRYIVSSEQKKLPDCLPFRLHVVFI